MAMTRTKNRRADPAGGFSFGAVSVLGRRLDRTESRDLSAAHSAKLEESKSLWFVEAGKYYGVLIDDRSAMEVLTTPRPQMVAARNRCIYYQYTLEVPEAVAANIRGRSASSS